MPNPSNPHQSWSTEGQPDRKRVRGPSYPSVSTLPDYIKPLTTRTGHDEATYLRKKGALSLPSAELRSEILRSFIEYVDPFMPTLELYDFLETIENGDGRRGQISLLLFHAVMFAGSAFVGIHHLQRAGYANRRHARGTFFQRARVSLPACTSRAMLTLAATV